MENFKKLVISSAATSLSISAFASDSGEAFNGVDENYTNGYDVSVLYEEDHSSVYPDVSLSANGYSFNPATDFEAASSNSLAQSRVAPQAQSALNVNDMVARVKEVFGLNGVQMAQAVRISRPSLYNHLKGMDCDQSIERYTALYTLSNEVSDLVDTDIRKGLKSVLVEGKTLLSYLKEEDLNREKVLEVSKLIAQKISDAPQLSSEGMSAKDQIRSSRSISRLG